MPRTATPRSDARQRTGKTSSQKQTAESQVTPVLFRLPEIELKSLITATGDGVEVAVPEQLPPTPASVEKGTALQEASHLASRGSVPVPGPLSTPSEQQVVRSAVSPVAPLKLPTTKDQAPPAPASSTFEERSWWEHWSSGVVLILLVIALVAASIMALNDQGDAEPQVLADKESDGVAMDDQAARESTVLPTSTSKSTSAASNPSQSNTKSTYAAQPLPADASVNNRPTTSAGPSSSEKTLVQSSKSGTSVATPSKTLDAAPAVVPSAKDAAHASQAGSGLMVNVPDSPLPNVPVPELLVDDGPASGLDTAVASGAATDVGVSPAPQFPDLGVPGVGTGSPAFLGMNQPLAQPSPANARPDSSQQIVLIPELPPIDVAANQASQPLVSSGMSSPQAEKGESSNQPRYTTQSPSYQTLLRNSSPSSAPDTAIGSRSFTTVSHASQSSTATDSHGQGANSQIETNEQRDRGELLRTPTPDMNADALIQVWQEFRQLRQMESQPSNRYATGSPEGQSP